MPVTRPPSHRSRRAALPHRAPALGRNAHTLRGLRVADTRCGEPACRPGGHPLPGEPVPLTASAACPIPGASARLAQPRAPAAMARPPVVTVRPQPPAAHPGSLRGDGPVPTLPPGVFALLQCAAVGPSSAAAPCTCSASSDGIYACSRGCSRLPAGPARAAAAAWPPSGHTRAGASSQGAVPGCTAGSAPAVLSRTVRRRPGVRSRRGSHPKSAR